MLAKPIIPQTKIVFTGQTTVQVKPSSGATVAVPLVHDWGPLGSELNKPEVMADFAAWLNRYGDSATEGRTAVAGAFAGQNLSGAGGAGGVIPWRMGTGAVRAFKAINNTTPVVALTITAKWTGTRGNRLSYVVDVDPNDATRDRLRVKFDSAVVETYSYPATAIDQLRDAINARSTWLTAVMAINGVRLTATAGTSLAAGTDGAAPTGADHLAAQAALEFQPFGIIAPANLTDGPITASYLQWIRDQEASNRPIRLVLGGAAGETLATAITRSTTNADPHVVNFGVGTWHDDLLNLDLSTAQLAPRIAGILAAKGEDKALTGAELGGLHMVGTTGPDASDAEAAIVAGVTVLIRTDSEEADVRIAKGVTTFTSTSDAARPLAIFSEPRFIAIMDNFVRGLRQWGDKHIIGSVPVNQDTRDAVVAEGTRRIDALLLRGLLLTKAGGAIENPYIRCPVTTDDSVPFEFGWQFAYTANFLLGEGKVR